MEKKKLNDGKSSTGIRTATRNLKSRSYILIKGNDENDDDGDEEDFGNRKREKATPNKNYYLPLLNFTSENDLTTALLKRKNFYCRTKNS